VTVGGFAGMLIKFASLLTRLTAFKLERLTPPKKAISFEPGSKQTKRSQPSKQPTKQVNNKH
jgi:hypothetical protein